MLRATDLVLPLDCSSIVLHEGATGGAGDPFNSAFTLWQLAFTLWQNVRTPLSVSHPAPCEFHQPHLQFHHRIAAEFVVVGRLPNAHGMPGMPIAFLQLSVVQVQGPQHLPAVGGVGWPCNCERSPLVRFRAFYLLHQEPFEIECFRGKGNSAARYDAHGAGDDRFTDRQNFDAGFFGYGRTG